MKMEKRFEDVEKEFGQLKQEFVQNKISDREFRVRLKKLRLRDVKGKCWTIGAQTGKWYYFDGKDWIESQPPSIQEGKAICIYCGFENDIETEVCANCGGNLGEEEETNCPKCGSKLDDPSQECPKCSAENKSWEKMEREVDTAFEDEEGLNFTFRSLSYLSLLLFWGSIGLFIGIVLGAFAGATNFFPEAARYLPSFILQFQGKLLGGIIYGLLGGVVGFVALGFFGFFSALIINMILAFIGGIKIRLEKTQ